MKKTLFSIAALVAVVSVAASAEPAQKAKWHFPVHLNYISGMSDVMDVIASGADDKFEVPFGLSFQPYAAFPNGLGVGGRFRAGCRLRS